MKVEQNKEISGEWVNGKLQAEKENKETNS